MKRARVLNQFLPGVMAGVIILAVTVALLRSGVRGEKEAPEINFPVPGDARSRTLPLNNPSAVPVAQATHMEDKDLVLGVFTGQAKVAYPWWLLANHTIVNDTVAETPVVITLDPVSSATSAFKAVLPELEEDTTFSFGKCGFGKATFRICDLQTLTRWHPFQGTAVEGRLVGFKLERLPTLVTTWQEEHPQSEVVLASRQIISKSPDGIRDQFSFGNPTLPTHLIQATPAKNHRLPLNTLILGLLPADDQNPLALPLKTVTTTPTPQVYDLASGKLLIIPRQMHSALAYWIEDLSSEEWGVDEKNHEITQGEQRWTLLGQALGQQSSLKPANYYITEWFEWVSSWPDSEIYGHPNKEHEGL